MVNNFLLLVLGDENPFDINLFDEDLKVEEKLFTHFGGRTTSSSGKQARMGRWVMSLLREKTRKLGGLGSSHSGSAIFCSVSSLGMGSSLLFLHWRLVWLRVLNIL